MIYQGFARVYDQLMTDTPYDEWFQYLIEHLESFDIKGKDILELACGTGEMTRRLSKMGYKVLGTDLSQEMLEIAQEKSYEANLKIQYVQQNMTSIELFQKYDVIISYCDGFNYLTTEEDFHQALVSARNYLKEAGYLIFDVSSFYKISEILGHHTFTETSEEVAFIWNNYYDEKSQLLEFDLTLFEKSGSTYIRHDEVHKQKAYTLEKIKDMMNKAGFDTLHVLDTNTNGVVKDQSERWLFIGRKRNE